MTATTKTPAILIAHDEAPLRRYLRHMLSMQGYRVLEAANALQALAKVERKELELVLIKLELAGGLEVIRHVRQSEPKLPLLCSSTEATNAARSKPLLKAPTIVLSGPTWRTNLLHA
jgi:CheY-like chemotaxis protein